MLQLALAHLLSLLNSVPSCLHGAADVQVRRLPGRGTACRSGAKSEEQPLLPPHPWVGWQCWTCTAA